MKGFPLINFKPVKTYPTNIMLRLKKKEELLRK